MYIAYIGVAEMTFLYAFGGGILATAIAVKVIQHLSDQRQITAEVERMWERYRKEKQDLDETLERYREEKQAARAKRDAEEQEGARRKAWLVERRSQPW
jgi:Skp family chaperone for outer membrane proteins